MYKRKFYSFIYILNYIFVAAPRLFYCIRLPMSTSRRQDFVCTLWPLNFHFYIGQRLVVTLSYWIPVNPFAERSILIKPIQVGFMAPCIPPGTTEFNSTVAGSIIIISNVEKARPLCKDKLSPVQYINRFSLVLFKSNIIMFKMIQICEYKQ